MFRGITNINIDTKGRMAVPVRYRDFLSEESEQQLILTIDTEWPCLLLYPTQEWEVIEAKLQSLSSFNPATRRIQRLLIGHATELEMDNTGRILLPPLLRQHASLDKTAMLVGQGKKFELWDEGTWIDHRHRWLAEEAARNPEEIPTELLELSL